MTSSLVSKVLHSYPTKFVVSFLILVALFSIWVYRGIAEAGLTADLARDLNDLSTLWIWDIVWLGPQLRVGFPASPLYYYLLLPGLWLSGGSAYSLIVSHAVAGLSALWLLVWLHLKQKILLVLLIVIAIGLAPWWVVSVSHAWNGHLYVPFLLLSVISLWHKQHLALSSILLGIAVALHPAAVLVLPLLFYEWVVSKNRLKNLLFVLSGLVLPWTPILIFEVITKGYLVRQFVSAAGENGLTLSPSFDNFFFIIHQTQISKFIVIPLAILGFIWADVREKRWFALLLLPVLGLSFIPIVHEYYLYGLVTAFFFLLAMIFSKKKVGWGVILLAAVFHGLLLFRQPLNRPERSISKMQEIVAQSITSLKLDQTKSYAVVGVRDMGNSTPQADDYRFFLRTAGINTTSIAASPTADYLLLYIEPKEFNWRGWEDWHTQHFGPKKQVAVTEVNGVQVILFQRE